MKFRDLLTESTTFDKMAKKLLSTKDMKRIKAFASYAETDVSPLVREVLKAGWRDAKFVVDNYLKDVDDDYILRTSLDTLVYIYEGVDFQKVMDKLGYNK